MCNFKIENIPIIRGQMLRRFTKGLRKRFGDVRPHANITHYYSTTYSRFNTYSMPLRKSWNALHLASILASAMKKQIRHF
jgi:hypothetical protein